MLAISDTAMESPAALNLGRPGMDPRTASPGLAELGRRVGASERTLSRLFRDEVGMGYTVWRNQLRLPLATLMLAAGKP